MAPNKLINKSRGVGSKKRTPAKPPKTPAKAPKTSETDPTPTSNSNLAPTSTPTQKPQDSPTTTVASPLPSLQSYTGLTQVPHGLNIPSFDPNTYFAGDLFANSSKLQETSKEEADKAVESIEKKRHTLRIVGANIALNTDVVRIGNDYRKFEGAVIDFATTGINNETKFVNYQIAGVNKNIAINKFDQTQERLAQGQKTLAGIQSITPLIDDEWAARRSLKQSQIKSLEVAAIQAKEALEPKLMQISQDFRQELNDLN
jgi:hypothetical protein